MRPYNPVLTAVYFEPEHYNATCGYEICESWVGEYTTPPGSMLKRAKIMGATRKEVLDRCSQEGIRVPKRLLEQN